MILAHSKSILERVIVSSTRSVTPDAARMILTWNFSDDDRQRMALLAAKAREGMLTDEEKAELNEFSDVSDILTLLHLRADHALHRNHSGN